MKLTKGRRRAIDNFLKIWHEFGRARFERMYKHLDYDSSGYRKTAKERRKYVALDSGTSGAFLMNKETGEVFNIKAYGVPKNKIGHIDEIAGTMLAQHLRAWGP